MTQPAGENMEADIVHIGDEALNEEAADLIGSLLRDDEIPVAVAGFDFETKVIAITDQRVIIASGYDGLVLNLRYDDILTIRRDERTLVIRSRAGAEHRHRFGKDETVQELVETAHREEHSQSSLAAETRRQAGSQASQEERANTDNAPPISERVRFWEEQDRINQELIPRVIKQHELLSRHVSDHDILPIVAANAAREAVEKAQDETLRQLDEARAQSRELARQIDESKALADRQSQELQEAEQEREKLGKDLEETKSERERLSQELEVVKGERERLSGEVEGAKAEREEQKRQHEEELSNLKGASRTLKVVACVASAAAATAIVVAIIL